MFRQASGVKMGFLPTVLLMTWYMICGCWILHLLPFGTPIMQRSEVQI